ncbi:MAG TPA: FAD:protein FMN transferase [Verrucomicrobiae bacterium]|nr:FAD:protein FMN transferase [Verrucomicrobiae bacterium]
MATRFEFVLAGTEAAQLRAAGEEAFDEIERIEAQLSLYRASSEIAQVNARAADEPVKLSPPVFELLQRARILWEVTGGSFDVTIAPLVRCWGFMKGSGARPDDQAIREARAAVGMNLVEFSDSDCSIRFLRRGMMLDLGSLGKGYALDAAAQVLRDAGLENALLHGGTSTIYGMGTSPDGSPWKVGVEEPALEAESDPATQQPVLSVVELSNQALSVSAASGKFFVVEGKRYGHVIDPRSGWPAESALLGAAILDSAADSDALSTAVLLARESDFESMVTRVSGLRYLQARAVDTKPKSGRQAKAKQITILSTPDFGRSSPTL